MERKNYRESYDIFVDFNIKYFKNYISNNL